MICFIYKTLLLTFIPGLFLLIGCSRVSLENVSEAPVPEKRMNLVMICLDTLRPDRLGCYGYDLPTSPFLDALSRRSVLMTDVLAQNPSTIRSHRAIFTGKYVYQQTVAPPAASTTMAGRFADAGYLTAAFTDGGLMNAIWGNNPGFQVYNDDAGGSTRVFSRGLNWIDENPDQPFFLFLHTYDVHYPYVPPFPFNDMFLPEGESPYHLGSDHGQDYWNRLDLDREEFIWVSRRYDGGVRNTDGDMKILWSELRDRNLLDDTVIVILSDHGESLGERRFVGHRDVYDVQIRVPLFVYIPGMAGHVLDGAVETVDILPTILDMFNMETDQNLLGRSLAEAIKKRLNLSHLRPRLSETFARAFRLGPDWKMILRDKASTDELYQSESDPEETHNVLAEQHDIYENLHNALADFTGSSLETLREVQPQRHQVPVMLLSEDDTGEENMLMKQLKELGYMQ